MTDLTQTMQPVGVAQVDTTEPGSIYADHLFSIRDPEGA